ncbi:hypothetical protein RO3G_01961 [Rhizopus delemar RA 99-880]|uniref:Uncharacterized protein n=1 Tax=Rhizopus delemar (strain RA 99-880 / ATCC MYA-4621 / FGSC 9543 / NRRL 43880) TaxID=246409 RepID=I1BM27_RHIO9|nr:hypothetical protein RO3G_01961 [Rhizopus delemar RA 99-880]|eukprot:EIE77257.1 hypothetical protein RO3G_01961 [Rhizopus delemar RA 99-880]
MAAVVPLVIYISFQKTLWLLLFPAVSNLLLLWILVTTGSLLFMGFIYYALLFAASMVKPQNK